MNKESRVSQIGIDLHKRFSKVTLRDSACRIVGRARLNHGDRVALRAELSRWPEGTPVIMESTFGWQWMSDELQWAGLDPHLANSRKVAGWRKSRGLAKNDRLDADLISELWSEKVRWWEVWLAPADVRERREWLRYRMSLVEIQTGLKNRMHAVLHRHGIFHDYSDLFGRGGRRLLTMLITAHDITLPESAKATLKGNLQILDQVRRQIARVTRELRKQIKASPEAERLRTLPGVSWVLAYTLWAEIGDIQRFKSSKNLASYSLVAPRDHESAFEQHAQAPTGRHVGFIGRRTLKWAFIEAAHGAVRKSKRFRKIFDRRTDGGKRNKNRGYITVGHELCRVGYVLLSKEMNYTENPPARPGSARKQHRTRPVKGQPELPLVAV